MHFVRWTNINEVRLKRGIQVALHQMNFTRLQELQLRLLGMDYITVILIIF